MKTASLVLKYSFLGDAKYVTKVSVIHEAVAGVDMYGVIPDQCSPTVLKSAYDSYKEGYQLAINGDRSWIAERKKRRAEVDKIIFHLGLFIQMVCDGDLNKLLKSGFDVKMPRTGSGKLKEPVAVPA
jgi:hypothetical protein